MVDVYSAEPERRAALEELTALRRELKTETAAGAKAAAKDSRFIAAKERLDKAKSAAGMRTSAEDLAALNRTATSDTATMKKVDGKMTAAPTKAERAVTKELNAPSKQYFKQVKDALTNPEQRPTWTPTGDPFPLKSQRDELIAAGFDLSGAKRDWILVDDEKSPTGKRWAVTAVGAKPPAPKEKFRPGVDNPATYALQVFYSGNSNAAETAEFLNRNNANPEGVVMNGIRFSDIVNLLPSITYQELERLFLFYGNQVDSAEELVSAYQQLFGGNK